MKFNPIEDRVVLEVSHQEEGTTLGGVIMPDLAKEINIFGKVIAVGPGLWNQSGTRNSMQCTVGDKVFFPKVMGKQVEFNDDEYYIIKECEILTIIKESK